MFRCRTRAGLNNVREWMRPFATLSNGQQARVRYVHPPRRARVASLTLLFRSLALWLKHNATVEDLGASIEPRAACSVAAGVGRLVRSKGLQRVVITTAHPELIPWLGPDAILFLPSGRVCVNPVPLTRPKARRPIIDLKYDDTVLDTGALPPAAEYAALAAQRGVQRVTLTSQVQLDAATAYASRVYDLPFDGTCTVQLSAAPDVPPLQSWRIGALLGPSGCGKSTHLAALAASWTAAGHVVSIAPSASSWPADLSVLSHLGAALVAPPGAAGRLPAVTRLLAAVGLRAESWLLPLSDLSSGERELAALAYALTAGECEAAPLTLVIADEFTSAQDDCAAYDFAVRLEAYVRARPHLRLVVAGVRDSVRTSLRPDWAYDVLAGRLDTLDAAAPAAAAPPPPPPPPRDDAAVLALCSPATVRAVVRGLASGISSKNRLQYTSGPAALWAHLFEKYHYLDAEIGQNNTTYLCRLGENPDGDPIGFVAVAPQPGRLSPNDLRPRLRESRMVIEPGMQGLGIGPVLTVVVAKRVCLHGNNPEAGISGGASGSVVSLRPGWPPFRYMAVTALTQLGESRSRNANDWYLRKKELTKVRAGLTVCSLFRCLRLTAAPAALRPGLRHQEDT